MKRTFLWPGFGAGRTPPTHPRRKRRVSRTPRRKWATMQISLSEIAESVTLIGVANAAPVALKRLLSDRYSTPVDGGLVLGDGRRLLGPSKTWRGVAVGILAPAFLSHLMNLPWQAGGLIGAAAMVGDCLASFVKRRLGLAPSSMALGLDQIPESLLPAISMRAYAPLSAIDILMVVLIFFIVALALSRVFFRLGLRERPY
jgi:CDP-diglyceride synthetase